MKWVLEEEKWVHDEELQDRLVGEVNAANSTKAGEAWDNISQIEKQNMLKIRDTLWKDHLGTTDQLRQGINLRAYANKNPKQEYKRESFALFESLLERLKHEVVRFLSHVQVQRQDEAAEIERRRREDAARQQVAFEHAQASATPDDGAAPSVAKPQTVVSEAPKDGRNAPCACGSGKKYKQCHGTLS